MKVKSGTRRRVLGREPGRWSMFGFAIIWFPAGNARRIQRNSGFWGVCVGGGGCLQNSAWYRMYVCSSIPLAFPWVLWDLILDQDSTVLSTPGKTPPLSNCPFCVCPSFSLPCHLFIPRFSAYSKISQSNSCMYPQRSLQSPLSKTMLGVTALKLSITPSLTELMSGELLFRACVCSAPRRSLLN